ncbi:hypothetical protein NEMIN01_0315 [Nematocida minor]|uniref:uncharacterized protein n=1 Tax=Nematocida minor TaxID=1912983 RepID=UPI002220F7B5|nr:uncharacterized protein NEMIN01_0315 [Nematocida minor]KAI5189149.1 hypothetical protein NEMIN01_0315 [Nematocida minor]
MAFIQKLADAIEKEYPKERADSSWDNTGILLEFDNTEETVLLCIDLTEEVVEEALRKNIKTVLAYHPPIFSAIKRITQNNKILHKCINNKISIYSPHTAFDGGMNGINHWLSTLIPEAEHASSSGMVQIYKNKIEIKRILAALDEHLSLKTIRYSLGTGHTLDTAPDTLAIGAGASSRVIKRLIPDAEAAGQSQNSLGISLVITGEASHHDLLYFKKSGVSAIVLEHSRSERGFLKKIEEYLKEQLPSTEIAISEEDRDPVRFYPDE